MAITSFVFDEQYYLTENPDVAAAVSSGQFASGQDHFQQFGRFEGRDPNALFDTSFYLGLYPDVAAAGVNPFQHFLDFGAEEGRFFNANIEQVDTDNDTLADEFDSATYLAANPDVAAAVAAGTFANAYQHYVLFGQFENRSGTQTTTGEALTGPFVIGGDGVGDQGTTFTLTQGTDAGPAFTGGEFDDVFNASVEQTAFLPIQTLNNTDNIDGGGGRNTLNAQLVDVFTIPAGLTNIQELNIDGAPGLVPLLINPTLDVLNANAIDEIGFRAPTNSITINNLQTALQTVNISDDSFGNTYTINHIGTALDGATDALDVNLSNAGFFGTGLALTHASGGADAGYETINIDSSGPVSNFFTLINAGPDTVNVTGTANLALNGGGLDVGTLDLLDASSFEGDLTATFGGTGDVNVLGGLGNDSLFFGNGVNATASGGEGDDSFEFFALGNGNTSFTTDDSVDGEGGDNRLILNHTGTGGLLTAGVGAGILNIQTIVHQGDIAIAGNDLTVDMAESGSANILRLEGEYDLGSVTTINNLTNDDFVVLDAFFQPTSDLNLNYAAPGALNILNLELAGGQTVAELTTQTLTEVLNLTSSGETANSINDASQIEGNVVVLGDTNLTIGGSGAGARYNFDDGVIDADGFGGDLTVFLGTGNQTVNDGAGNDVIWSMNTALTLAGSSRNVINLGDGADTVGFADTYDTIFADGGAIGDTHLVTGFDLSADTVALATNAPYLDLNSTNSTASVGTGDAVLRTVESGELANLSASNFNFLLFTAASVTGGDVDDLFDAAIGAGSLTVANGTDLLGAAYDSANSLMVLFRIDNGGGTITAADDAEGIATIEMSYADFVGFDPSNIDFVTLA